MSDVYHIVLPDGQEFAWHKSADELREVHPGAVITGRLVMDETGQGSWEPMSHQSAVAKARKADDDKTAEAKPEPKAKSAEAKVEVVALEDKNAK